MRFQGYSYNEIHATLGIPKSTLSNWFSRIALSEEANKRLRGRLSLGFIRRNKQQTVDAQKRAQDIRALAAKEVHPISDNDLLIIGAALYWAEGYKRLQVKDGREITAHVIGFTNSDPQLVSAFVLFLTKILNIPNNKIFIEMRLFKHIKAEEAIEYWMNASGLARSQFKKPSYPVSSASKGIRPKNRLPYGTVRVIVSDTKLFYKVMGLIDGIKHQLEMIRN